MWKSLLRDTWLHHTHQQTPFHAVNTHLSPMPASSHLSHYGHTFTDKQFPCRSYNDMLTCQFVQPVNVPLGGIAFPLGRLVHWCINGPVGPIICLHAALHLKNVLIKSPSVPVFFTAKDSSSTWINKLLSLLWWLSSVDLIPSFLWTNAPNICGVFGVHCLLLKHIYVTLLIRLRPALFGCSRQSFCPCAVMDNTLGPVRIDIIKKGTRGCSGREPKLFCWVEDICAELNAAVTTFLSWSWVCCAGQTLFPGIQSQKSIFFDIHRNSF